eukprot:TRINITY_DN14660_c0_g1_i1.p1 TRINITY_DN14660_c0_g1~~TRINITY_DN14660_c0_g1_i1.p1  ORF type:complete len:445 (-),score=110.05 TRINITY_DN14660_c0_g1_i1:187-1521(-)
MAPRPSSACSLAGLLLLLSLPLLWASFSVDRPNDKRVLVILDDLQQQHKFSILFSSLSARGYSLVFRKADDKQLALQKYGEWLYSSLVIFAPKANSLGGSLDVGSLTDFLDAGNDIIAAIDDGPVSDIMHDLAVEIGIDLPQEEGAVVIDHHGVYASEFPTNPTIIAATDVMKSAVVAGDKPYSSPVLFQGVGLSISTPSDMVFPALSAPLTAFSAPMDSSPTSLLSEVPALYGRNITLVAAMQANNNARALFSGSLDLFSDKFLRSVVRKESGERALSSNEQFVEELSKWTLHERGHLKAVNLSHHKVGEKEESSAYRVTDHVEFSVEIYEWRDGKWQPYAADDVQVQLYMMSPYVRLNLQHDYQGKFFTTLQVPDAYGVFQWKVEYRRPGFSSLALAKQIPVRPFRHDEFERFLPAAAPYYASTFSMMIGFFIFGFVFLYHK